MMRAAVKSPWGPPGLWILVTVVAATAPSLGLISPSWTRIALLVALIAMIVSGLNLSWGYGGELAVGQAALYAAGAYTGAYVAVNYVNDVLVCLLLASVVSFVIGLLTGIPGLRLGGWTLAMISFFLVVLVPSVVNLFGDALGGFTGFIGIPIPELFGRELGEHAFFAVVAVTCSLWFAFYRNVVTGRTGRALLVMRESPDLATSLGIWPYREKLTAYAVAAIPAGMAGALFAYLDGYIAPENFSLHLVIVILAASILGGPRSIYGAFLGAAILEIGPLQAGELEDYATIGFGLILVLGGIAFGDGIMNVGRAQISRIMPRRGQRATAAGAEKDAVHVPTTTAQLRHVTQRELVVKNVTKRFGGNVALSDVDLTARPGQITALIGPNGSGKTTLLNVICGFQRPDEGSVELGGQSIIGMRPHRMCGLGIGRTFQTPLLPEHLTVEEVIASSRYGTHRASVLGAGLRTRGYRRTVAEDEARVMETARALGLQSRLKDQASTLSLGTRRMVELARVMAGGCSVLLLDEVASGLDEDEIHELARSVRLARDTGATVVLVEHNFALVKLLADSVVVLADGALLAAGSPAEIEADPAVRERYIGSGLKFSGTSVDTIGSDS